MFIQKYPTKINPPISVDTHLNAVVTLHIEAEMKKYDAFILSYIP